MTLKRRLVYIVLTLALIGLSLVAVYGVGR